jgi:hypothetical protein
MNLLCTFTKKNTVRHLYVYFSHPTWNPEVQAMPPSSSAGFSNSLDTAIIPPDDSEDTTTPPKRVQLGMVINNNRFFENVYFKLDTTENLSVHLFTDWAR